MSDKYTVLVVDDAKENLAVMSQLLKEDYRVVVAKSGEQALQLLTSQKIDIVLLDVVMPNMDGYQVITHIKSQDALQDLPVIFLTGKDSVEDEEKGFELGACDYINKPISPPIVKARVRTHIQNKRTRDFLKDQNTFLEKEIIKRTEEMSKLQDATITAMASLAETRDQETGNHIRRTQLYVKLLADKLHKKDKYKDQLTVKLINIFYKSAPLHDIGKVGIPDNILLKPGKLDFDEFEVMKQHTDFGFKAIENAESEMGADDTFLKVAKEIAHYHHEKWDGSGYPDGLKGEAIPLSARLMAIADVYDALISKRVYKDAMTHEQAMKIIAEGRGSHFDPDMIDAFFEIETEFYEISQKYTDG
ncbi:two-component system response regulator [Pseudoalteromonas sp. MMG013]|uniref:response regulator n=1 Tax=Pseudoalteromonas sp. MMG013 TaxID=2822687 RepID=UPI001B38A514|nr:two-component system response regulator [Pseudoalteromonas sp. MMG013]MBQ4863556.1 two-component system response regulator [Pseudoalteromonas sp. MMG013]